MSDYLPDPIELMERRIDDLAYEADYDLATDTMLCGNCKRRVPASQLCPASPHPDAPAWCDECLNGASP